MKKKFGLFATTVALAAIVAGCGSEESNTSSKSSNEVEVTAEERIIQDQLGRDVTITGDVDRKSVV